jgi:hypothetical protein
MRRKYTLSHLRPLLPSHWREARADATGARRSRLGATETTDVAETSSARKAWARTARARAFRAQTFPHLNAVYADALCLTCSREAAADLVVEAYRRAFLRYDDFQRAASHGEPRQWEALAWLYRNLHTAFCDEILARTPPREMSLGGYS